MPVIADSRRLPAVLLAVASALVPALSAAQEDSPEPVTTASPSAAPTLVTSPVGAWDVVAYDAWEQGLIDPLPDSRLRLTLLEDGDLEGLTGCDRFNGGWSRDGDALFMGVAPTGNLGCGERQAGEAIGLSTAIGAVAGWRATDTGVELLDAAGDIRLVLEPLTVGDPVGAWEVRRYRRPNGRLVEPLPEAPMSLTLRSDGTIEGSTGCRVLLGEYRLEGTGLTLGPFETDGLPCDDDRNRPERQLLRALGEVVYWHRQADRLALADGFDELVVELVRGVAPTDAVAPEE